MGELGSAIAQQFSGVDYDQHQWITGDYTADTCENVTPHVKAAVDNYVSAHGTGEGLAMILWFGSSRSFSKPGWWVNYSGTIEWPKDDPNEFEDSDSPNVVGISGDEIFDIVSYYHREPIYEETVVATADEVSAAMEQAEEDAAAEMYPTPGEDGGDGGDGGIVIDDPPVDDGITVEPTMPTIDLDYLLNHDPPYLNPPDPSDEANWSDEEREMALSGEGNYRIADSGNNAGAFVYDKFAGWEKVCDWESAPMRYQKGLKEACMYATSNKVKVYWMSLSVPSDYATLEDGMIQNTVNQFPATNAYIGYDDHAASGELNSAMQAHTNAAVVKKWNEAMKSSTPAGAKYVDIYEPMRFNNPYFNGKSSYQTSTSQTIWHIMWNTVQELNPRKEMGEAIETGLYAISCSLTAYVNGLLGVDATEEHASHTAPSVTNAGNGGDYLGYGDREFNYADGIISADSKVSSAVAYRALLNQKGDSSNYMYLYGRYGYLLSDLGLDSVARGTPKIPETMIPGGAMTVMYSASALGGKVFNVFLTALQYTNPFQFISRSSHLAPGVRSVFSGDYDSFTEAVSDFSITGRHPAPVILYLIRTGYRQQTGLLTKSVRL